MQQRERALEYTKRSLGYMPGAVPEFTNTRRGMKTGAMRVLQYGKEFFLAILMFYASAMGTHNGKS